MSLEQPTETQTKESPWSFDSGHLALDFANTVDWHASDHPEELLNSYADLVQWTDDHAILTPEEIQSLASVAQRHPKAAGEALDRAIALRESVYRIFAAVAHDRRPEARDLAVLKEAYGDAVRAAQINAQAEEFTWSWEHREASLEMMLWPVSHAAMELLFSDTLSRVGQCADDRGCGMLFIDTSRNRSRQWCSMDACGNRAKAQRHYRRSKSSS